MNDKNIGYNNGVATRIVIQDGDKEIYLEFERLVEYDDKYGLLNAILYLDYLILYILIYLLEPEVQLIIFL